MFAITRGRLVAVAFGLSATVASAQGPFLFGPVAGCPLGNCAAANHGTYGPALFAANTKGHSKLPGPDEPSCIGRSSTPAPVTGTTKRSGGSGRRRVLVACAARRRVDRRCWPRPR